jgi:signal peptidase I
MSEPAGDNLPSGEQPEPAPAPVDPEPRSESVRPVPAAESMPPEGEGSVLGRYAARHRGKKAAKARKPHRKAPWWELPLLVVVAIVIAILVKTFIVQPFYIPSESMEKTLAGSPAMGHDRILVNKLVYDFRDPHPGDIVVFNAPAGWDDEPTPKPPGNPALRVIRGFGQLIGFVPPDGQVLVKRVIATGGQTVKGDAQGNVYVSTHGPNGPYKTLNEPYVYRATPDDGDFGHARFGPVTVPKGRLWVMGDHRDDSKDSRFHCGPNADDVTDPTSCDPSTSTVPVSDVIGKAFVVAWPPSHWRTLGTPPTFKDLASGAAFPGSVSLVLVVPVFLVRRRRRRR